MTEFATELTNIMSPNYMKKLGLTKAPFSTLHDEASYFENDNKINIQKKIAHLLEYTNLVLFIQGATGSGKTEVIKRRILTRKEDWLVSYISAKNYTKIDALIEKIATDFSLDISNETHNQHFLQKKLSSLSLSSKLPILIIDDIEHLKADIIPFLAKLIQPLFSQETGSSNPAIRLVIAGEDIPAALLKVIPKQDEEEHLKYLQVLPLTEAETSEYLAHRLKAAGYQKQSPFNRSSVEEIYLESKGFPDKINILANQWLSKSTSEKKEKKSNPFSYTNNNKLKIAAASLASLVIIVILTMSFSGTPEQETKPQKQTLTIPSIPTIVKPSTPELSQANTMVTQPNTIPTSHTVESKQEEKITADATPTSQPLIVEKKIIAKPQQITPAPPKPSLNPSAEKKTSSLQTSLNTANWVNKQNPNHFTLQLIGGRQKSSAQKFITTHGIKNGAHIFSTTRNDKPWYSVIYKSYPSRTAAQAASNTLPKSLKKIKPWIRTFAQIKKDMK